MACIWLSFLPRHVAVCPGLSSLTSQAQNRIKEADWLPVLPPHCSEQGQDQGQGPGSLGSALSQAPPPECARHTGDASGLSTKAGLEPSPPGLLPARALATGPLGDQNLGGVLCHSNFRDLSVAEEGGISSRSSPCLPAQPLSMSPPLSPAGSGRTEDPEARRASAPPGLYTGLCSCAQAVSPSALGTSQEPVLQASAPRRPSQTPPTTPGALWFQRTLDVRPVEHLLCVVPPLVS